MQARRIRAHSRYCDDILITAEGGNGKLGTLSRHWKFVAKKNKSPYLLEGCVVSSDSIVFLETEVYEGPRWKTQSGFSELTMQ